MMKPNMEGELISVKLSQLLLLAPEGRMQGAVLHGTSLVAWDLLLDRSYCLLAVLVHYCSCHCERKRIQMEDCLFHHMFHHKDRNEDRDEDRILSRDRWELRNIVVDIVFAGFQDADSRWKTRLAHNLGAGGQERSEPVAEVQLEVDCSHFACHNRTAGSVDTQEGVAVGHSRAEDIDC